jgi:hypothetical protein
MSREDSVVVPSFNAESTPNAGNEDQRNRRGSSRADGCVWSGLSRPARDVVVGGVQRSAVFRSGSRVLLESRVSSLIWSPLRLERSLFEGVSACRFTCTSAPLSVALGLCVAASAYRPHPTQVRRYAGRRRSRDGREARWRIPHVFDWVYVRQRRPAITGSILYAFENGSPNGASAAWLVKGERLRRR